YSPPMAPSLLSKISSTVAWLTGLRAELPEKITSVSESPRRRLAELSPMTQRTASMMFDLPQPFGPTMPVMLVGRCSTVGSTKDLKPASLIVERRMRRFSGRPGQGRRPRGVAHAPLMGSWGLSGPVAEHSKQLIFLGERDAPAGAWRQYSSAPAGPSPRARGPGPEPGRRRPC